MSTRWGRRLLTLVAAATLAACAPDGVSPVRGERCQGVPLQTCTEILEEARRDAPEGAGAVVGIDVRCTIAVCTQQRGEVDVTVTYADGTTTSGSRGWMAAAPAQPGPGGARPEAGPTPLPVEPVCIGVDPETCLEMGGSGLDPGPPPGGPGVESILVRCATVCGAAKGEGETIVRYADGTTTSTGWSYESGE